MKWRARDGFIKTRKERSTRLFSFPSRTSPTYSTIRGMSSLFATGGNPSSSKKPYSSSTPSRSSVLPHSSSRSHSHPQQQQPHRSNLSPDQQTEIQEAFELFDLDKDKRLDYHEFKVSLRALGFDFKKAEVLKLMRERNTSGNGEDTLANGGGGQLMIGLEAFLGIGKNPLSLCLDN